ncbi:MAG: PGPGW domain-containing protein [Halioglobus sp.]|nr:PGPGW domain-containing protein [Halioglobus sp.]
MKFLYEVPYRYARRIVIALVGSIVLLTGVIMLVTPGPAFVVIPIGLGILGLEFAWARRWLRKIRKTISEQASRAFANRAESHRHSVNGKSR